MLCVFAAKMLNYLYPPLTNPAGLRALYGQIAAKLHETVRNTAFLHSCPKSEQEISIPGGWQCVAPNPTGTPYDDIFRTYPAEPGGRDHIYASTAAGSKAAGAALLAGVVQIPRYKPVRIGTAPTWREDPYHSVYWRFNYYALRPTENLLTAYLSTGDAAYSRALVRLDVSFFEAEASSPLAWADYHAVAFRSMVLVHQWWVLREYHQLPERASDRFLRELEKTGQFLLDRNHYQPQYNHGVNESAALLELGLVFPTLPHAQQWREVARERIRHSINDLIDADGSLVENSPYYHFYTLDKYWQILKFTDRLGFVVAPSFRQKLMKMTQFATYVLQPDSSVPLLGSSIAAVIHDTASFAELARADPSFRYVLTQGAKGKAPAKTSIFFPHAGLTVLRSGWGKGDGFRKQSYLTFNVGAYRTEHSQLDALSITLFGAGRSLVPAPGLYTYPGKTPGPLFRYFHGTGSHNTVVVDGRDQIEGAVTPGPLQQYDGVTYQSAESSLYPGVSHRRMVMMLDASHFLVIDRLTSQAPHRYQQVFHFFPGAKVQLHGLTATGAGTDPDQSVTIRQLGPVSQALLLPSQRRPPSGLCSERYHQTTTCVGAAYVERGTDAAFTTLLTIGPQNPDFRIGFDRTQDTIRVVDGRRRLTIRLGLTTAVAGSARATHLALPPTAQAQSIPGTNAASNWLVSGNGTPIHSRGAVAAMRTVGSPAATLLNMHLHADLGRDNLQVRVRVSGAGTDRLSQFDLAFSNRNWSSTVSDDLRDAYPARYDGEWLTISLARSQLRDDVGGHWVTTGGPFDWGRIDGVRLTVEPSNTSRPVTVALSFLKTIPQQKEGVAVIVFDDGYDSILPAAAYLHEKHMPANVAVIGKYTSFSRIHHLTKYDLLKLQNQWGWNMASHTEDHVDAVEKYARSGRFDAYRRDLLQGTQVLQQAGLDSAPDWLIYPNGAVNAALERIVSHYYRFARTTDKEPEAYPFGDPLRIKTLEVAAASDSRGASAGSATTPEQVARAVRDTLTFHSTLILTFHRIHARQSDPPGYPLDDFKQIVDDLEKAHIRVVTLSGLERLMGIPANNRIVISPGRPSQITANLKTTAAPSPHGLLAWLSGVI